MRRANEQDDEDAAVLCADGRLAIGGDGETGRHGEGYISREARHGGGGRPRSGDAWALRRDTLGGGGARRAGLGARARGSLGTDGPTGLTPMRRPTEVRSWHGAYLEQLGQNRRRTGRPVGICWCVCDVAWVRTQVLSNGFFFFWSNLMAAVEASVSSSNCGD